MNQCLHAFGIMSGVYHDSRIIANHLHSAEQFNLFETLFGLFVFEFISFVRCSKYAVEPTKRYNFNAEGDPVGDCDDMCSDHILCLRSRLFKINSVKYVECDELVKRDVGDFDHTVIVVKLGLSCGDDSPGF